MVFSELHGVDMPAEIDYLVKTNKDLDGRTIKLLKEVALDNESIDTMNLFVLKYTLGELSKEDLLIAINRYRASNQSVVD